MWVWGECRKEIVKWVKKKTGPPAPTIETVAELDALKASNGPLVVGYFAKLEVRGPKYAAVRLPVLAVERLVCISDHPPHALLKGQKRHMGARGRWERC